MIASADWWLQAQMVICSNPQISPQAMYAASRTVPYSVSLLSSEQQKLWCFCRLALCLAAHLASLLPAHPAQQTHQVNHQACNYALAGFGDNQGSPYLVDMT